MKICIGETTHIIVWSVLWHNLRDAIVDCPYYADLEWGKVFKGYGIDLYRFRLCHSIRSLYFRYTWGDAPGKTYGIWVSIIPPRISWGAEI